MSDPKKPSNPSRAMFGLDDPPPQSRQPQGGTATPSPTGGGPYSFGPARPPQTPPAHEGPPYGAAPASHGAAAYQEIGAPAPSGGGNGLRWLVLALLVLGGVNLYLAISWH